MTLRQWWAEMRAAFRRGYRLYAVDAVDPERIKASEARCLETIARTDGARAQGRRFVRIVDLRSKSKETIH